MEKNRIIWLDILKIIACFLVIINHSGSYIFEYTTYNPFSVLFYSIHFALCKMGVPIFLMTTGYLLLLNTETKYKNNLKRVFRILIPLIIMSFIAYISQNGFHIKNFIVSFLNDPIWIVFWYLYMLCGLYLILPFIRKMIRNFELVDFRNFIIICLVIPGIIPIIQMIFHISISAYFTLALISYPIVYSVAGIYLSKIELNKRNRNIAFLSFLIPIIIFTLSLYLPFLKTKEISYLLDSCNYITTSLPALSLFYLIRYFFSNKSFKKIIENSISQISMITFGIYLFHFLFLIKMSKIIVIQHIFLWNPYIGIICFQWICFIICGIITYLLRKIPIVRKFL